MIGSHRLVNAIENGSYATHGDLTTALATTRTRAEFQGAIRNTALLTRLMSNQVAVPLIIDSTTASTDLFNSDSATLCTVLPNSYEFMKAIVTTTARFDKLKQVPGIIDALHRSSIAVKILNTDAIDDIFSTFPFHYEEVQVGKTTEEIVGVVYSSLYKTTVAISTQGIACKAPGQDYFNRVSGTGNSTINDIASNTDGSIIVVVSDAGILYSTNGGYSWLSGGTSGSFTSVIYGSSASLFVCQKSNGDIYSSSNGSGWTLRDSSVGSGSAGVRARGYAAGLYAFQSSNTNYISMVTSTDGIAWTEVQLTGTLMSSPADMQLATSIAVYDANNAFAAGITGVPGISDRCWYAQTTDGGATWTSTGSGSTIQAGNLLSVAATDVGWMKGYFANQTHTDNITGFIESIAGSGGSFQITENQTALDTAWPAYGRKIGLFSTKSAGPLIVGATSGSVVQVSSLKNPSGSSIVCSADVPPFITANGIYFAGTTGNLYCSNIAKTS